MERRVDIAPLTPATPHSLTREEVFVVLDGEAAVDIGGVRASAQPGDAIVVPADVEFALANDGDAPLRLLCCTSMLRLQHETYACSPPGDWLTRRSHARYTLWRNSRAPRLGSCSALVWLRSLA